MAVPVPTMSSATGDAAPAIGTEVVATALRVIAQRGLGGLSVDELAGALGVSRATAYRLVPGGRDALVAAVVAAERRRLLDEVDAALAAVAAADLTGAVAAGVLAVGRFVARHDALHTVLAREPEAVLPHVSFRLGDRFVAAATACCVERLAPHLPGAGAGGLAAAAEVLVRQVMSHVLAPSPYVALADPGSVSRWVDVFVAPGLVALAHRSTVALQADPTPQEIP
jgi:AcrR family transcriptional regulator